MALFDPHDLVRLAGRIDDHANALRTRGHCLRSAAQSTRWHSPAAATFREQVEHLDHRLQHAAHNLDRAAAELRTHARRVRTVEHALTVAVRAGQDVARAGEHLAHTATHEIEHVGVWLERQL